MVLYSVRTRLFLLFCPRCLFIFEVVVSFFPCLPSFMIVLPRLFFSSLKIVTNNLVCFLLTYLRSRTYLLKKRTTISFNCIYFHREGTDLGTNVFVSLIPDGQSYYKYD